MSIVSTTNTALTSGATRGVARLGTVASKGGILGKIAGFLGKGLKFFANMSPWGKIATIAMGALTVSSAVKSHPASRRVG